MQASDSQRDRFKAEMPHIPGVYGGPAATGTNWKPTARLVIVAAALTLAGGLGWWALRARGKSNSLSSANFGADDSSFVADSSPPPVPQATRPHPNAVATTGELAKPWSAKKFTFVDPATHASAPAMILRLPGTAGNRSAGYWAFSLNAPYATCQLDYVTDLNALQSRYGYRASHPMLVAGCSGTIYDPLKVGTAPSGAWVRGDIAQGGGIRPPLSIELSVNGDSIIADRME